MTEEHLSPKDATYKSMEQISGALIGIGLVISAVFLPMAFFGGSAGIIYHQFAITIISAMGLSVLIALIFTPALCATLLKPHVPKPGGQKGFFGWFNRTFETSTDGYERGVKRLLRNPKRTMVIYLLLIAGMAFLFKQLPTAFLPGEDQGTMMVQVQTPANSSAERTQLALDQIRDYVLENEQDTVDSAFAVNGFNFAGRGQSSGILFLGLKPFEDRTTEAQSVFALADRIGRFIPEVKDATVIPIVPPAIMEMGNGVGFDVFLQDNSALGHDALMQARNQFLGLAAQEPALQLVRPNGLNDEAQYQVTIDDEKARALQVSIESINDTMSVAWGSAYVNDFIDKGRVKKVYVQGEQDGRISPEDFDKWYVRNAIGQMVPFSAFATGSWIYGSPKMERYGGISAVEILGEPAPGYSSGDAMAAVERIAAQLPKGIGISWTGLSYEERAAGSQAPMLYALSLIMVFLCLAAMYESWSVPVSVMLVVPLGVLGAVAATLGRGLSNDVFFQVGMLTTMGLAAKNAILIVEFAKELYENQGRSLTQAAVEAARLRARGQVQAYKRQVAQDANALRLLLGAEIPSDLQIAGLEGQVLATLPVGLPSDLLRQRPDIRAAEHSLQAANANVGAARAAFFPSVTLTANAGTASNELSGLFNNGSESWSFVPQIHLPIFNGGRLKASLDYSEIQKDVNVASYEQAIQIAFREVSDGLAATGTWGEQVQSQRDLVKSTDEYTQMAQQRYDEGVDNYLTLLDAQRSQLSARQALLTNHLEQLKAQIQLYKALGGGWSSMDVATAR